MCLTFTWDVYIKAKLLYECIIVYLIYSMLDVVFVSPFSMYAMYNIENIYIIGLKSIASDNVVISKVMITKSTSGIAHCQLRYLLLIVCATVVRHGHTNGYILKSYLGEPFMITNCSSVL
jgi:hypothetical protein